MKNIVRKYLSRWHPSTEHWTSKNVKKLIDGVEDKRLKTMITSPGGIQDLLRANGRNDKIEAPTFFYLWDMEAITTEEGVKKEFRVVITNLLNTMDPVNFLPFTPYLGTGLTGIKLSRFLRALSKC